MDKIKESPAHDVFAFFKAMNQVPRGSGNEEAISNWLVDFAKERDLEVIQDEAWNVIIKKPASKGYEGAKPVIIQGHMDMVPEKEADSDHDFEKDPIALIVDGDYIHADKTTLGADNGIAVAMALAILDSHEIEHPALEVVITTEEETGMGGAFALDAKHLEARQLINLDSEAEGELLTSCSGGLGTLVSLPIEKEELSPGKCKIIKLTGLQGGHSGMEIDQQRGNAVKLLARVLYELTDEHPYQLIYINGGSKHNAIPREAEARIHLEAYDKLEAFAEKWTEILRHEFHGIDQNVQVVIEEPTEPVEAAMTQETRDKALAIINLTPTGVINMSADIEGLVQTSNNLGILITKGDVITFQSAIRSSVRTMKYAVASQIKTLAELTSSSITYPSEYPAWEYAPVSRLRDIFIESYKEDYDGKEPHVTALHAGLECGVFAEKLDNEIDMISFGPNLYDVHTPKERMQISSVERTYHLLLTLLKNLK